FRFSLQTTTYELQPSSPCSLERLLQQVLGPAAELAVDDEAAQDLHDAVGTEQRGDVGGVVQRRDLDEFHAYQPFGREAAQHPQDLPRRQPAGHRRARAGRVSRIDDVDVEAQPDGVGVLPGDLQGVLDDPVHAIAVDVVNRDDGGLSVTCLAQAVAAASPTADPNLDEVAGRRVRDVGGVEEGRAVHALVVGV